MKAQALLFVAPGQVELRTVEAGEPGDDDVVVRTAYSGVSTGTELLAYRGQLDPGLVLDETIGSLGGTFSYPFPYGYSCAGVVEGGALPEGTPVFAFHPHQDRFVAARADVVRLGDGSLREATLFPLVETALQISLDAGPVLGEPVVVTGLGAVGLLTALLLRRAGARVVAAEPRRWRREAAAALGVDAHPPEAIGDRVADETGGRGVPLVVEASGNPEALAGTLPWLAHEGTALVASWYGARPVTLPLGAEFHRRRLVIRSTQVSTIPGHLSARWTVPRRRETARRLLGELPLGALATHEYPAAEAMSAFAALDRGEEGLLHAALWYS
ncbi:MAG TPA: zinc-binding alcohol dehydrogenase [Acidimicrobiia bacterium]|nr:zinc-binding alcohol dehydrogenase [Acidimicrobiia bacterium]